MRGARHGSSLPLESHEDNNMSQTNTKLWKAVLTASALSGAPAHAANDAMMGLLEELRKNGTISQEAYESLINAAKADDEHVTFAKDEISRMQKETPKIDTKGKLEITSPDKDFKWRIGGRLHADATIPDNDSNSARSTNFEDKTDIRRMRLDLTATVWKDWQFKIQYDFADSGANINLGLRDAWLKYLVDTENVKGSVTAGHFKEYIGLDELTSSNDISFIERSLMSAAYNATNGRRLGVGASLAFYDKVTASLGGFGRSIGNAADDAVKATGRLTFSPIHSKTRVVHLGAAGSYVTDFDTNTFTTNPRPEFDVAGGTRLFNGFTVANADDAWRFGGEGAVVYGPFSLQGEYQLFDLTRTGTGAAATDLSFDGWYVFGSWLLTGESRVYKFEDGVFQNPKPSGVVGKGGWGAWEVLARYSQLNLHDSDLANCNLTTAANFCGEETNVTLGLNWYPNQNFKFMANYVWVTDVEEGRFDGVEPSAFAVRAQAYF